MTRLLAQFVAFTFVLGAAIGCAPTTNAGVSRTNGDGETIALGRGGITLSSQMETVPLSDSARESSTRVGTVEIELLPPRTRSGPTDARTPFAVIRGDVLESDALQDDGSAGWVLDSETLLLELVGETGLAFTFADMTFDAIVTLTFDDGRETMTERYRLAFTQLE